MDKSKRLFISLIIGLFIISSCTPYVPYTLELKRKYKLTNEDLKNVQYYLSNAITLQREVTILDSKKIATGHSLKSQQGKLLEVIEFPEKVAGIVKFATDDSLQVSFESGKQLTFYKTDLEDVGTIYKLRSYVNNYETVIVYDYKEYSYSFDSASDKQSIPKDDKVLYLDSGPIFNYPILLVVENNLSNIEKTKRVVPGIKLQ